MYALQQIIAVDLLFFAVYLYLYARDFHAKLKEQEIYRVKDFLKQYQTSMLIVFSITTFAIVFPTASIVAFVLGIFGSFLMYRTMIKQWLNKMEGVDGDES